MLKSPKHASDVEKFRQIVKNAQWDQIVFNEFGPTAQWATLTMFGT